CSSENSKSIRNVHSPYLAPLSVGTYRDGRATGVERGGGGLPPRARRMARRQPAVPGPDAGAQAVQRPPPRLGPDLAATAVRGGMARPRMAARAGRPQRQSRATDDLLRGAGATRR